MVGAIGPKNLVLQIYTLCRQVLQQVDLANYVNQSRVGLVTVH